MGEKGGIEKHVLEGIHDTDTTRNSILLGSDW